MVDPLHDDEVVERGGVGGGALPAHDRRQAKQGLPFRLLSGRLLSCDLLTNRFHEVKVRKDPACPLCGTSPTIHELKDETGATCEIKNVAGAKA